MLKRDPNKPDSKDGIGGLLDNLRDTGAGGLLGGGIGELLERFKQTGKGDIAESWIKDGPNKDVEPGQLRETIGPEVLATLVERTGLPEEELLARLSRELPTAVDKYTPQGRLPAEA
jgi:uncharacterized protein YidB (DUF937 family)